MSGPKTSRYVLTEAQRKQIENQQRIIRETKVALNKYSNLHRKCKSRLNDLIPIIVEIEKICKESGLSYEELQFLKQKKKEFEAIIDFRKPQEELQSLINANKELEKLLLDIKRVMDKGEVFLRKVTDEYKSELSETITGGLGLSFSGLGSDRKTKDNPFMIKISAAINKVEEIALSVDLKEKFERLQKRAGDIKSIDYLENFCSMQVYPFVHECEFYRDHIDEFDELLSRYEYLVMDAGEVLKHFTFSEENLYKLKTEIERLNSIILSQKEQEYICQAVDEAMIEMGYELVGERSVTKKSGKKFRNGLYVLEEGTAVNVTYADTGQISMELGALDTRDRMPLESEALELAEDMRSFCEHYANLEKRLLEKGVTTKRISVLPPTVEYAQVINATDYELKRPLETYRKEKKKASSVQQMRKEG